ncbi:MAG TPA: glycosyltransferase [Pyrinomonadaceae bacterium]|jgi:polysaccharide deacetylase family protein (PEP-CTERM system associated)
MSEIATKKESATKPNLLTVLLEDYFQVGAFDRLIREQTWSRFEPRYVQNTLKTLDLLDKHNAKATFFVLGWIAENTPDLIREIAGRGHEIASRGYNHCPLSRMSPAEFRADARRTREVLERASRQRIFGHRAAEKLNYTRDLWTLDVLAEEGFVYDASFLPTWKGIKNARLRRAAHEHRAAGKTIWEIPYSTARVGNYLLPISGGNYFRQLPYTLMRRKVQNWIETEEAPFVLYFHVWELDEEQPRINAASRMTRVRHYRKLDKMAWILNENLSRYRFTNCSEFLGLADVHRRDAETQRIRNNEKFEESNLVTLSLKNSASLRLGGEKKEKVTVVIPCYNEEKSLPYLANTLKSLENALNYDLSFIFVDDCSKDATFEKLKELFGAKPNVRIIRHDENKGVAAGIMTGLRAAETEIVCSIDADCTYDPHELTQMIPLLTEDAAMVTASPYHPAGGVRNVPAWRLSLSQGASFLYKTVLQQKLSTYTSCFRVYRRSRIENVELQENGFLGVAEMLGKLVLRGERVVEHPAILEVRLFGFSKMKTARTIAGHIKLLTKLGKMRLQNKTFNETEKIAVSPAKLENKKI